MLSTYFQNSILFLIIFLLINSQFIVTLSLTSHLFYLFISPLQFTLISPFLYHFIFPYIFLFLFSYYKFAILYHSVHNFNHTKNVYIYIYIYITQLYFFKIA